MIVTWFSESRGKIKTVAKGARRPKSGFAGRLDLFFTAELSFSRGLRSDLLTLREVAVRDPRENLRQSYPRIQAAAYFVELIELSTEPDHPAPELYDLLRRGLDYLVTREPVPRAILHFESELSRLLGLTGENNAGADPATAILGHAGALPRDRAKLLRSLAP